MDVRQRMREHPLVIRSALQRPETGRAAWILAGVEALLYPFTLYFGLTASDHVAQLLQFGWWGALSPLLGIEFAVVGALILHRHPGHGVGLIAVVGGFCMSLSAFAGACAAYSLTSGHQLPATGLADWLRGWIWYPATSLLFVVLPALFPDGRLPSPRWRPILWAAAIGTAIQFAWVSLSQLMFGRPIPDGPYPTDGWVFDLLTPLSGVLWIVPLFASVAALALRFRRSRGAERQQLKWFLAAVGLESAFWAGALLATVFTGRSATYQIPYFDALIPLSLMLLPVAIAVAILRHRLYDIDLVISRGLVYGGLAAFITAAYLLLVVGVGFALGTGGRPNLPLSVVAMALVVVLVQPVRARLQTLANRLVYGAPADPYALLAELSKTPAAGDLDRALAQIAEAVARGMGSMRARVSLLLPSGQSRSATWPVAQIRPFGRTITVTYGGNPVGEIAVDEPATSG